MMKAGIFIAWNVFGLCLTMFDVCTVNGDNTTQTQELDAFQLFALFSDAAGVKDVNREPLFKCLRANRTEFDYQAPSATYLWSLNAGEGKPRNYVPVHYTAGKTSSTFFTSFNSDPSNQKQGWFLYTDYKTCGINVIKSFGYQCILWVDYQKRYSYPEECDKAHAEFCGESVSLYKKELCGDTET
ncbi:uncharacterized protein LOC119174133 [Rhipicephalus microplus]|uniref:uncharacterized protein LOC119174133 n=1 Tax=Rhipicephalus microplus TaxID=6941 RepID=UPI003F6C33F1